MEGALFDSQYITTLVVAVAAILIAAAILGTISVTRDLILAFGQRLLRRGWSAMKQPFAWGTAGLQECRRLYGYMGRDLTWDDLPQNSKDSVSFRDLNESARQEVRLNDLSEFARQELRLSDLCSTARQDIRLSDLPQSEKQRILSKIFLAEIYDSQYCARLVQFEDANPNPRLREINLVIQKADDFHTDIWQDAMELRLTIEFQSSEYEIPFDEDRVIHFHVNPSVSGNRWIMGCKPKRSWKEQSGIHKVDVWIYHLRFNGLVFYQ